MLRRSTGDWPSCSARERLARPRQSAAGWSVCAPASCARLRISPTASTGRGRTMTVKDPTTYLRSTPTPQTLRGVISLLKNLYTYESINDVLTLGADLSVPSLLYEGGTTKPAGSPAKLLILETGAVLGTAATGYTQIGHVATDILDITVGATATGKVRVNNTTTSTSVSTGAIVNAGGQGIAGPLWVGGLANIAGAVTLQSTLALATANITGTPTITGSWTFEGFPSIRGTSNPATALTIKLYTATIASFPYLYFNKSASGSLGTAL